MYSLQGLRHGPPFHYQCADSTQPACQSGPGKSSGVRVESFDPPVFMVCPDYFTVLGDEDPSGTTIHEATHIFGETRDHGYGGPCEYFPAGLQYDKWFSMLRLPTEQLVANADTYENWITEFDYSRAKNILAQPEDGICPDVR